MAQFLMQHWFVGFVLLAACGSMGSFAGGSDEARREEEEADEWAAHPMNKEGMNYKG